ncbi:hypothetical protein ACFY9A_22250 [Streptomyces rubradiris]
MDGTGENCLFSWRYARKAALRPRAGSGEPVGDLTEVLLAFLAKGGDK